MQAALNWQDKREQRILSWWEMFSTHSWRWQCNTTRLGASIKYWHKDCWCVCM